VNGIINEEMLQKVSDDDEMFASNLSAQGIPKAIGFLLFEKYVVAKRPRNVTNIEGFCSHLLR